MKILLVGANGKMGREMSSYLEKKEIGYFKIDKENRDDAKKFDYDIVLDFSTSACLYENLELAKKKRCPIVIATTNHTKNNYELIQKYSKIIPIFMSANFSILFTMLKSMLDKIKNQPNLQTVVCETHHQHKKDKPSGSAKQIIKIINSKNIVPTVYVLRVGEVVGEHKISFYMPDEELEIVHTAFSKRVFCNGAYMACKFISSKQNGVYDMEDLF